MNEIENKNKGVKMNKTKNTSDILTNEKDKH